MLFSTYFNITQNRSDDWFDPIIDEDTLLFVDPFLVFQEKKGLFKHSQKKVIAFFNDRFNEAASTPQKPNTPKYKALIDRNVFKEPAEACLGYSNGSTKGSGGGTGFAKGIVRAIYDSIAMGLQNPEHFEELGIFNQGIKEDRISDITINILKQEFITYTQKICAAHNIKMQKAFVQIFDSGTKRWIKKSYELPFNPYNKLGIILIPKRFITNQDHINSDDFLDYAWGNFSGDIQSHFNIEIKSNIKAEQIISIARANKEWVSSYIEYKKNQNKDPYDFEADPEGVYSWHNQTLTYATNHPIESAPKTHNQLKQFLSKAINQYVAFIEDNGGYELLWNDNGLHKKEKATQLLFYGIIKHYCIANNIDITREGQAGRGPVDFKFSLGYSLRALLEVKLAKSNKLIQGLEKQLPIYLKSENIDIGFYLVVCFKTQELTKAMALENEIIRVGRQNNVTIIYKYVDATNNKPSASRT